MQNVNLTPVPVSSVLAQEIAALGERIGQSFGQCRNEKECAALEDALQALTKAKKTLDHVSS
ncbi:hypothetical protein ACI0X9_003323 [Cronobacter turicensis]